MPSWAHSDSERLTVDWTTSRGKNSAAAAFKPLPLLWKAASAADWIRAAALARTAGCAAKENNSLYWEEGAAGEKFSDRSTGRIGWLLARGIAGGAAWRAVGVTGGEAVTD